MSTSPTDASSRGEAGAADTTGARKKGKRAARKK
jgi:hypothetical protein